MRESVVYLNIDLAPMRAIMRIIRTYSVAIKPDKPGQRLRVTSAFGDPYFG